MYAIRTFEQSVSRAFWVTLTAAIASFTASLYLLDL